MVTTWTDAAHQLNCLLRLPIRREIRERHVIHSLSLDSPAFWSRDVCFAIRPLRAILDSAHPLHRTASGRAAAAATDVAHRPGAKRCGGWRFAAPWRCPPRHTDG